MIETSRRKFITGLSALIVAPAIVRVESLMPVRSVKNLNVELLLKFYQEELFKRVKKDIEDNLIYGTTILKYSEFNGLLAVDKVEDFGRIRV